MTVWQSILYGIIQGLTEFLPVSSSGHLALFQALFDTDCGESSLSFSVLLHLGTLIAVFIVYSKDIWELIVSFFTLIGKLFKGKCRMSELTLGEKNVIFVIIATLPLVPAALLSGYVEVLSSYIWVIGIILCINAVMLYFSDKIGKGDLPPDSVKPRNALAVGLVQMIAVLPGLSRSGSTITAGLAQGYERPYAVKFSFILSIPAILGACILELPDFIAETANSGDSSQMLIYLTGAFVAMLVGIFAMKLLQLISKKSNFRIFSYYSAAVGILAIVLGIAGM